MGLINELDKEAMDIALKIVECEHYEKDSDIKQFKLSKLREELEQVKCKINEVEKQAPKKQNGLNITPFTKFFVEE